MIERVFCFSEEMAQKNRIKIIKNTFIAIILFSVLIGLSVIPISIIPFFMGIEELDFFLIVPLSSLLMIVAIIIFSLKIRTMNIIRMRAFAKDNNGKIYMVQNINTGMEFIYGGYAVGNLAEQFLRGNNNGVGGGIGTLVGTAIQNREMSKSIAIMAMPEVVAQMVVNASRLPTAMVFEILRVNSYILADKYVKINCDYRILGNGIVKTNKNIKIHKCYVGFDELMNILIGGM